jgi:hypothetical protein
MNPQTFNPYVYCLNNPLKYVDPDGRAFCYPEDEYGRNDRSSGPQDPVKSKKTELAKLYEREIEKTVKEALEEYRKEHPDWWEDFPINAVGFEGADHLSKFLAFLEVSLS